MSKNHLKTPPELHFSGALSASLQEGWCQSAIAHLFPEHCRPLIESIRLRDNPFRTIVGHLYVESPNFASITTTFHRHAASSIPALCPSSAPSSALHSSAHHPFRSTSAAPRVPRPPASAHFETGLA